MNNKTLITIILTVVIFGAGFVVGRMTASVGTVFTGNKSGSTNVTEQKNTTPNSSENGTTIDSSNMTEGQRKLISALGLDPNNVTITAEMIACAEEKLGATRVEEIKNGATPSILEGTSLVACY